MNLYLDLFLTFAKVGVCTFGGGYAMLPILQREVVDGKGWATESELADYYAVGQCTPGIIAVNTATFVGAKEKGVPGGIAATLGLIFPCLVIIGVIAAFLSHVADNPWVGHAFAGVRAAVCALILSSVLKLRKTTIVDPATAVLFAVVFLLSAASVFFTFENPVVTFFTSPVVLVVLAGVAGLCVRSVFRGWRPGHHPLSHRPGHPYRLVYPGGTGQYGGRVGVYSRSHGGKHGHLCGL